MKRILALGFRAAAVSLLAAAAFGSAQAASPVASVSTLSGPVLSPRLSDLPPAFSAGTTQAPKLAPLPLPLPNASRTTGKGIDPGLQNDQGLPVPLDFQSFFGGIGENGYIPPDPNIAVGKTYIVQVVNSQVAVFNKSGGMLSGYPKNLSSLFSGLSGCSSSNAGDPIVQYDNLADSGNGRWLITELGSTSGPFSECIAVSTGSDPTGTYNLYADTQFGSTLNDYPKFGVWPTATNSAYLATYNLFANAQTFTGAMLCAYDRTAMLAGTGALGAPRAICYTISNDGGFLPSDLDGATPPADGTPGYFLNFETGSSLRMYTLSPNFASTPTGTLSPASDITVYSFSQACGGGTCIAQPNSQQLDSLGDRLMYRLAYRVLGGSGGTPTMVVNHSVTAGSSVGVRWYELQNSGGGFAVAQQGTFAPDSAYRWMGSAAMDGAGDIAIGYSKSSGSINPAIVFTGRTPIMPAGTMGTETVMQSGAGAQSCASRWGDYTALRIDPSDDTTFWYTNEYYSSNSFFFCNEAWKTAIGSFTIAAAGGGGGGGGGANPDFSFGSVSPNPLTVTRGSSNMASVPVSGINSASSVSLSISGLSKGIGANFNPNPVTAPTSGSNSSTLTIKANGRANPGTYGLTITGNNSFISHSTSLTLTVQ